MKVLNLDALVEQKRRAITIDGTDHPVVEMSVEMFVQTMKAAKELSEIPEDDIDAQISATVAFIHRAIPTLPPERIRRLTMEHMNLIAAFINGVMDDEVQQGAEQSEGN